MLLLAIIAIVFLQKLLLLAIFAPGPTTLIIAINQILLLIFFGYQLYALLGFNVLLLLYYVITFNLLRTNYFHYCN